MDSFRFLQIIRHDVIGLHHVHALDHILVVLVQTVVLLSRRSQLSLPLFQFSDHFFFHSLAMHADLLQLDIELLILLHLILHLLLLDQA